MYEFRARKVNVPFKVLGRGVGAVTVWVVPNEEVWEDGTSGYAVTSITAYRKAMTLDIRSEVVPVESLTDRRAALERFGVQSDEPLVSWRDLSTYGWGLDGGATPAGESIPAGNKYSYWTVFFAQNVMRGLLTRIMATEMKVMQADSVGEVYWTPWVEVLRKEVRAYDNVTPVRGISQFAAGQIKAMWRRVMEGVSEDNRVGLERALAFERGQVLKAFHDAPEDSVQ